MQKFLELMIFYSVNNKNSRLFLLIPPDLKPISGSVDNDLTELTNGICISDLPWALFFHSPVFPQLARHTSSLDQHLIFLFFFIYPLYFYSFVPTLTVSLNTKMSTHLMQATHVYKLLLKCHSLPVPWKKRGYYNEIEHLLFDLSTLSGTTKADGVDKIARFPRCRKKYSSWLASFLAIAICLHNLQNTLELFPLWLLKSIKTERSCGGPGVTEWKLAIFIWKIKRCQTYQTMCGSAAFSTARRMKAASPGYSWSSFCIIKLIFIWQSWLKQKAHNKKDDFWEK